MAESGDGGVPAPLEVAQGVVGGAEPVDADAHGPHAVVGSGLGQGRGHLPAARGHGGQDDGVRLEVSKTTHKSQVAYKRKKGNVPEAEGKRETVGAQL